MQCSNCKSTLGCGCQKRTASNGAQVCANCITSYEARLKGSTAAPPAPIINSGQNNAMAPSMIQASYNPGGIK